MGLDEIGAHFRKNNMKKRTLLLLISGFIGVCVLLFIAFYDEAKKTASEK
jgi:uncharacterized membrane protein YvbJ